MQITSCITNEMFRHLKQGARRLFYYIYEKERKHVNKLTTVKPNQQIPTFFFLTLQALIYDKI